MESQVNRVRNDCVRPRGWSYAGAAWKKSGQARTSFYYIHDSTSTQLANNSMIVTRIPESMFRHGLRNKDVCVCVCVCVSVGLGATKPRTTRESRSKRGKQCSGESSRVKTSFGETEGRICRLLSLLVVKHSPNQWHVFFMGNHAISKDVITAHCGYSDESASIDPQEASCLLECHRTSSDPHFPA